MEKEVREYRDAMTRRMGFMVFVITIDFLINLGYGNRWWLMFDAGGFVFAAWWFAFRRPQLDY